MDTTVSFAVATVAQLDHVRSTNQINLVIWQPAPLRSSKAANHLAAALIDQRRNDSSAGAAFIKGRQITANQTSWSDRHVPFSFRHENQPILAELVSSARMNVEKC